MNNKYKTGLFGALIVAMMLPFSAMDTASAQSTSETKYSKNYIERMFVLLEPVMNRDSNWYLSLRVDVAEDLGLYPYDMQFASEFILMHNAVMDADSENIDEALRPLTDGKFSNVFEQNIKKSFFSSTACGGHNMANPHPIDPDMEIVRGFDSLKEAQRDLLQKRYHMVPLYATFGGEATRQIDFAKVNATAYSDCSTGQFRDQAIIDPRTHSFYKISEAEPNPEVASYIWPTYWLVSYTHWWHQVLTS